MRPDIEEFFQKMKENDLNKDIPSFESLTRPRRNYRGWISLAAAVSLITMAWLFGQDPDAREQLGVILDTENSPSVTNTLFEPESDGLMEWEAPSDYLSNDFN